MGQQGPRPSVDLEAAKHLHQIVTGYRASQVVAAVARFRIADRLADGPVDLHHLAVGLDIAHDHLYRLLRGAASIGLIEEVAPRTFALAPLGEPLRSDVAGSLRSYAMAQTAPGQWLPWARLPHAVVSRQSQTEASLGTDISEYHRRRPDEGCLFAEGTSAFNEVLSAEIVRLFDFSPFRRVVDMGAWGGTLLAAVLDTNPTGRGVVFDHSSEALPPGGDVYLLEQLLHGRSDDEASAMLRRCGQAMAGVGRVVVVETVVPSDHQAVRSQLSDLDTLLITGGCQRTADSYHALFASAGLELEQVIRLRVEPDFAMLVGVPG